MKMSERIKRNMQPDKPMTLISLRLPDHVIEDLKEVAPSLLVQLQKRADAAIKNLEAERAQLHSQHKILQTNAMQAIHDAVRQQSAHIER